MAIELVSKKKGARTCDEGHEVPEGATECPECGSTSIKKSLLLVRKAVGDEDDDLESAVTADDVEDENDDDLDSEDDEEVEKDDDEDDDEVVDEDEDEEDEGDDEEEDEPQVKKIAKRDRETFALEVLNISTALAEDVIKAFTADGDYEEVMMEFNDVMDAAAERWQDGKTVSKKADAEGTRTLVSQRVDAIVKGKKMPEKITKRDDLPEDVRKSLDAADKIVEERENEKWLGIAKGYKHFPGEPEKLAKSLRVLSETDEEAFNDLKKSLDAAEYNLEQSDVFKRYGLNGDGETDEVKKRHTKAEEIAKAEGITVEQAEVRLMGGDDYTPTNVG